MGKTYSTLLILLFFAQPAKAQLPVYQARVFDAADGISATGIIDIFKDNDDYLWIQYTRMLEKFDGRSVERFVFERPIQHCISDTANNIWVISGREVWKMPQGNWKFEKTAFDTSGGSTPVRLFQFAGMPITILGNTHFWQLEKNGFVKKGAVPVKPGGRANPIQFDTCGSTLFYPSGNFVYAYSFDSGRTDSVPAPSLYSIYALTPQRIAYVKWDGTSYWGDFTTGKAIEVRSANYGEHIAKSGRLKMSGIVPLAKDKFAILTSAGLMEYDLQKDVFSRMAVAREGKPFEYETGMTRLVKDRHNILWAEAETFITQLSPVSKMPGLLRNYELDPAKTWNNATAAFAEDNSNNLWMANGNGFAKLSLANGNVEVFLPEEGATSRLSHGSVRGIVFDGKKIIIAPTDKGPWVFDPVTKQYRRPVYASDSVRTMAEHDFYDMIAAVKNGDHLFPGRDRLYVMKANTYRMDFISLPGVNVNTNSAHQDSGGNIWITTMKGLYCLDEQYHVVTQKTDSMPATLCIIETSKGNYVVGTHKGIYRMRYQNGKVTAWEQEKILHDIAVTIIFLDEKKRFWIGSSDGLYACDSSFSVVRKFTNADNIQSQLFSGNAFIRTKSGMVFLGGRHGVNYFVPENFSLQDYPLNVQLRAVYSNTGDTLTAAEFDKQSFAYSNGRFVFTIAVPYYSSSSKLQYRYRLLGQNNNWIDNGNSNSISFTQLQPGNYELQVQASTNGSDWYSIKKPVSFIINPPFWKTGWFVFFAVLSLTGMLFWLIKNREKRLLRKKQQQYELEQLRTGQLQYQLEMEQVISYFSGSINKLDTVDAVLWDVAHNCISRLGLEDCVIYLLDSKRNMLVQKAAWGSKATGENIIINPIEVPVGKGITGTVALTGVAQLVNDISKDSRYIQDVENMQSELAVPVMSNQKVIGVIDSEHHEKNFYTNWHQQILQAVATLVGNKIELITKEEERRKIQMQVLENERQAAVAKLQSMRLQMNPHFLFNALNSIQQMIMTGNEKNATLYLSKFSKLLRMVLTQSDKETVPLKEEIELLTLYIELEALRFDERFTYRIDVAADIDTTDSKVPTLLIQPFVENAIWHGLLHKEGDRVLKVGFFINSADDIECIIEDNGIGRAAAAAIKSKKATTQHTGKGLSVSEERLKIFYNQNNCSCSLNIHDLYDAQGNPAGTRISVILPGIS